ncbi:MAG: hypothetical protein Ct9H300mP1_07290 [Planctomycetaceae bacterium]|nr:MAG: hypothetical protein Ct9H300mP1_07290 [Planctomycetaceae bacterium]
MAVSGHRLALNGCQRYRAADCRRNQHPRESHVEFSKPRIIYNLERTRVLSLQMIERVPHEQWFEMPTGVTHVAWHVVTWPLPGTSPDCCWSGAHMTATRS